MEQYPTTHLFNQMREYLSTYRVPSQGAEQDFLTDFFRNRNQHGITALPRSYNFQLHVAMYGSADCSNSNIQTIMLVQKKNSCTVLMGRIVDAGVQDTRGQQAEAEVFQKIIMHWCTMSSLLRDQCQQSLL